MNPRAADDTILVMIDMAELPDMVAAERDGRLKRGRTIDSGKKTATIEVGSAKDFVALKFVSPSARLA